MTKKREANQTVTDLVNRLAADIAVHGRVVQIRCCTTIAAQPWATIHWTFADGDHSISTLPPDRSIPAAVHRTRLIHSALERVFPDIAVTIIPPQLGSKSKR